MHRLQIVRSGDPNWDDGPCQRNAVVLDKLPGINGVACVSVVPFQHIEGAYAFHHC